MRKTQQHRKARRDHGGGGHPLRAVDLKSSSTVIPAIGHNNPPSPITDTLADDLLFGAQAIADALGIGLRRAFYLLERGHIPATKTGATWTSTWSRLHRHFNGEGA